MGRAQPGGNGGEGRGPPDKVPSEIDVHAASGARRVELRGTQEQLGN